MEESMHAATVLECKEPLSSRKVKEELIIQDGIVEESLLPELVKEEIRVGGELQKELHYPEEFEPLDRKPYAEGFSKSSVGFIGEEAMHDETLDFKEPSLFQIQKGDLTTGDEVLKEEPYPDVFSVVKEEFMDKSILESSMEFIEEEAIHDDVSDCKEPLLLQIQKRDLTTGDEVLKQEPYLDEFSVVKEELMEESILENVNPQLPYNQVTSVKDLKEMLISPKNKNFSMEKNVAESSLNQRMFNHSNITQFRCLEYDNECKQIDTFKKHMSTHSIIKELKCSACNYECNEKNMKLHMLGHSNIKQIKCPNCDYKCKRKSNLKIHMLTHSNIKHFRCSECDYECKRKSSLKIHMLTHSNIKQYKCSECDYECKQKSCLSNHMLTHSNIKQFKCSDCDYKCKQGSSLRNHMVTHSNTKQYRCSDCDYECKRKCDLKRHMLTHFNINPFKCSDCDYESNQKGNLRKHMLTHSNSPAAPRCNF